MNSQRSKDLSELKKQAIEYYTVNAEIPKKVEDALNSLFYESPYDAFGYLVNKKHIRSIVAHQSKLNFYRQL